jgi:hypothetical protein
MASSGNGTINALMAVEIALISLLNMWLDHHHHQDTTDKPNTNVGSAPGQTDSAFTITSHTY